MCSCFFSNGNKKPVPCYAMSTMNIYAFLIIKNILDSKISSFPALPVMQQPPILVAIDQRTVTIHWTAWNHYTDVGAPPLVEYIIYSMQSSSDNWVEVTRVDTTVTSITMRNLEPDIEYKFSVAAARLGPGGIGPRSPAANFRCFAEVINNDKNRGGGGGALHTFSLSCVVFLLSFF